MTIAAPLVLRLTALGFEISYYRLFMVLAFIVALTLALWLVKRRQLPWRASAMALIASALAFVLGARLFNIAIRPEYYFSEPWRLMQLSTEGLSLYGGLLAATLTTWLMARFLKLDIWKFGDVAAPSLGVGLAVMRIGCFLNGCCFGQPTDLPWGVHYPLFSEAHLWQMSHGLTGLFQVMPVHPTQLYEALYSLIGAGLALWLYRRKTKPGTPLLVFIIWLTSFRLANHFLRALAYGPLIVNFAYPLFYLTIIVICLVLLYVRSPKDR